MAAGRGAYFGPSLFDTADHYLNVNSSSGSITQSMSRTHYPLEGQAQAAESPYALSESAGNRTYRTPRASRALRGWLAEGFGDDVLFNQIYVEIVDITSSPITHHGSEYNVGFITEELDYVVLIWNSYVSTTKSFTALSVINPDGITITYPTIPAAITPGGQLQLPVTIAKDGPAVQDTTYQLTIGGVQRTAAFAGLRVLAMIPEPNWRDGISHTFGYLTAMYQNDHYTEQRRSLLDSPAHSTSTDYIMVDEEAQEFFHSLSYGHNKVFAVPFYSELMIPTSTGLPQGDVTITIDTSQADPAAMWNLNNTAEYVALIDHTNRTAEIKEISSIASPNIVVTQNISGAFDEATTRVYPVYFGMVRAATLQQRTDGIDTVKLDFLEFNNG